MPQSKTDGVLPANPSAPAEGERKALDLDRLEALLSGTGPVRMRGMWGGEPCSVGCVLQDDLEIPLTERGKVFAEFQYPEEADFYVELRNSASALIAAARERDQLRSELAAKEVTLLKSAEFITATGYFGDLSSEAGAQWTLNFTYAIEKAERERDRLRKALEKIANSSELHKKYPVLPVIAVELQQMASAALAADSADPGAEEAKEEPFADCGRNPERLPK